MQVVSGKVLHVGDDATNQIGITLRSPPRYRG
jgi:hypothetical protein